MSYKQELDDLLAEIDKQNMMKALIVEASPRHKINLLLERLSVGEWRISINKAYRWDVATSKKYKIGDHSRLKIESFEDFKKTLTKAIDYYLTFMEIRKYDNFKDYREKGINTALEIEKRINEDLYEDIMVELRRLKGDKRLNNNYKVTSSRLEAYQLALSKKVEATALTWVKENLASGMKLFTRKGRAGRTVKKIAKVGASALITFEGSEESIVNYEGIDPVKTWLANADEAEDVIIKANYYDKGVR